MIEYVKYDLIKKVHKNVLIMDKMNKKPLNKLSSDEIQKNQIKECVQNNYIYQCC